MSFPGSKEDAAYQHALRLARQKKHITNDVGFSMDPAVFKENEENRVLQGISFTLELAMKDVTRFQQLFCQDGEFLPGFEIRGGYIIPINQHVYESDFMWSCAEIHYRVPALVYAAVNRSSDAEVIEFSKYQEVQRHLRKMIVFRNHFRATCKELDDDSLQPRDVIDRMLSGQ